MRFLVQIDVFSKIFIKNPLARLKFMYIMLFSGYFIVYEVSLKCGRSSVVERHVANVNVVSSSLIARFTIHGWRFNANFR